jgi:DNA repair protein RecO (recombination protein O)
MLHKTRGIALSYIKYRESSIIARIFTEQFGLQTYIVNSVRTKKSRTKMALFQPLSLLDLVVYFNKSKDIQRISEIKFLENLHSIPFNVRKISISIFIAEFLGKILKEDTENASLFDFLRESVLALESKANAFSNFHLTFLIKMSAYLGIKPLSAESMAHEINSPILGDEKRIHLLDSLLESDYSSEIQLAQKDRNLMLDTILNFYRYHFDYIGECKSVQVLREVF